MAIRGLMKVFKARTRNTYDNVVALLENSVDASAPMSQKGTNGAGHVNIASSGPLSIGHNRNIAAAATTHPGDDSTNTATWTAAEGVTDLNISLVDATAGEAFHKDNVCLVVLDAPSAATAKTWLEDAGGAALDVEYFVCHFGEITRLTSKDVITRIDALPINTTGAVRVIVEAA